MACTASAIANKAKAALNVTRNVGQCIASA
jgi:hypothetical protein